MAAESPWQDGELLSELYLDEDLSCADIGEELGCCAKTVSKWLNRHDIPTEPGPKDYQDEFEGSPWRDPETLRELYWEEGLTTHEVAERLGCTQMTVHKWMERSGVDRRTPDWEKPPPFTHASKGHEVWTHGDGEKQNMVLVHRLAAVAWFGWDALDGKVVHHKSHIPWDTREDNLELMSNGEHTSHHKPWEHSPPGGWHPKD